MDVRSAIGTGSALTPNSRKTGIIGKLLWFLVVARRPQFRLDGSMGTAVRSANHHLRVLRLVLWISSHLMYLVFVLLLAIALIGWRWRVRKIKGSPST